MAPEVIDYGPGNTRAQAEGIAARIAGLLRAAIDARGCASLALSGGRSPVPMFQALRNEDLPWSKVWITLVDERWVASDSPDSNERVVREHLLAGPAAAAHFLGLKTAAASPAEGLADREQALAQLPQPFDAVVLGMGEDGHFASLFPGATGLEAALDPSNPSLLAAIDPPAAPHRRISLTLAGVLRSRQILLTIGGAAKRKIYGQALAGAPTRTVPVAALLGQHRVPVEAHLG